MDVLHVLPVMRNQFLAFILNNDDFTQTIETYLYIISNNVIFVWQWYGTPLMEGSN